MWTVTVKLRLRQVVGWLVLLESVAGESVHCNIVMRIVTICDAKKQPKLVFPGEDATAQPSSPIWLCREFWMPTLATSSIWVSRKSMCSSVSSRISCSRSRET